MNKNTNARKYYLIYKIKSLIFISGLAPKCSCCGYSDIRFLTIDHIEPQRSTKNERDLGQNLYHKIACGKKNLNGLQILCFNCNCAKKANADCPHKDTANDHLKIYQEITNKLKNHVK